MKLSLGTIVYANGAYIQPIYLDGMWRWIVVDFDDNDLFIDGDPFIGHENAQTREGLISKVDEGVVGEPFKKTVRKTKKRKSLRVDSKGV